MRLISVGLALCSATAVASLGCAFSGHKGIAEGTGGGTSGATGGETGGATGGSTFSPLDAAVEFITADTNAEVAPSIDANCGNVPFAVQPGPADVLIVLDKSGSMAMDATGANCRGVAGCSKWDQTVAALNTVVGGTPGINWGLKLFANDNMCVVNAGVTVPVGPGSAPMVMAAIAPPTAPGGQTPTAAAETSAGAYMATLTDTNAKFILLATDGQPNCGAGGGNGDDAAAIQSVLTVFNGTPKIATFVVGIATGGSVADTTLTQMAVNGGHPRVPVPTATDPAYYPVSTTADLVTALNAITSIVKGMCNYPLPPPEANADQAKVTVTVDGTPRMRGDPDGWDYDPGMTSLTFTGNTCSQLLAGTATNVQVLYGCKVEIPK